MANNDPSVRQILPHDAQAQNAQMGSFSTFAPQQYGQREQQKNYVFVDEHNRHKRLKVMRACEGCRRRKIKCDAATTNTWPCSACVRLKLTCVRPNGYDSAGEPTGYEAVMDPTGQFTAITMAQQQQMMQALPKPQMYGMHGFDASGYGGMPGYDVQQAQQDMQAAQQAAQAQAHYSNMTSPQQQTMMEAAHVQQQQQQQQNVFPTPPAMQQQQQQQQQQSHGTQQQQGQQESRVAESSPEAYSPEAYQQQDLADLLGTLKVDEAGTAPYLRNKASFRREEQPIAEDDEDELENLPPIPVGRGLKIRIPPELMPSEETILNYFDLYFTHVHPYVPVLNKAFFYQQWNTDRASISPLLLEAIFAIGGRLAEDPGEGQQWLALASRHADSFMDIPRLSTLQALLIILKAREAAPKRGYYYRSWMTIVQCVQMGKDLGLDEHFDDHQIGRPCDSSPPECQLRTRIWQTIFVCEVMVGAPQGRLDLAVDIESVDFNVQPALAGAPETEFHVSRNFTYFARVVQNVRKMSKMYARLRRKKEWGIDPKFQQLNADVHKYLTELPQDMIVSFPADGSPPWLPSHEIGNMMSYYYLTLILLHRPQLSFLDPGSNDGQWKRHMLICYDAAKSLCRLQEGIASSFGLMGLQCMQRGYSFTVYAGLSCIVLHLVAIVSPDPELNTDARQFFARHMRIMEKVMEAWHMPELQKQVDAVREAFSADVRKPFALKPSFPYGSPHPSSQATPPRLATGYGNASQRHNSTASGMGDTGMQHLNYSAHPISPPISAGPDSKSQSPGVGGGLVMMQGGGNLPNMSLGDHSNWNPSRLFEQWNTTFGTPEPSSPPRIRQPRSSSFPNATGQSVSLTSSSFSSSTGVPEVSTLQDMQAVNATLPAGQQVSTTNFGGAAAAPGGGMPQPPGFVTPAMWQESVASVYEGGLKRQWDFDGLGGGNGTNGVNNGSAQMAANGSSASMQPKRH